MEYNDFRGLTNLPLLNAANYLYCLMSLCKIPHWSAAEPMIHIQYRSDVTLRLRAVYSRVQIFNS